MNIKELRLKTGMKQKEFAEKFGIPVRTLQDWERPDKPKPPAYVTKMLERFVEDGTAEIIPTKVDYDEATFEQHQADDNHYTVEVHEKFEFVCDEIKRMVKRVYPPCGGERALYLSAGITPEKAAKELNRFVMSLCEDKTILWLGKKVVVGEEFDKNTNCWEIRFNIILNTSDYDDFYTDYIGASHYVELEIYFKDAYGRILTKEEKYFV